MLMHPTGDMKDAATNEQAPEGLWRRHAWFWLTLACSVFSLALYTGFAYIRSGTPEPWTAKWIAFNHVIFWIFCYALYRLIKATRHLGALTGWATMIAAVILIANVSSFINYQSISWLATGAFRLGRNFLWAFSLNLLIYLWMFGFYGTAQKLLSMMEAERQREARLADMRFAASQAQLRALRHQINPHFLFNTLNAISGLVVTGQKTQSIAMMHQLSDYLRSSTGSEARGLWSLAEELGMVEAYLAIERARFGDRVHFEVDCPIELRAAEIPSFILQPLVENSVKHAVAPSPLPVTIRIAAVARDGRLVLLVQDDGEVRKLAKGFGIGLRNIRERLSLLYGPGASLETDLREKGFSAYIALPLIGPDAESGFPAGADIRS